MKTTTLGELKPAVGARLRWAYESKSYPPFGLFATPHMWQVLRVEELGCVIGAVSGQGISPHVHLMRWHQLVVVEDRQE